MDKKTRSDYERLFLVPEEAYEELMSEIHPRHNNRLEQLNENYGRKEHSSSTNEAERAQTSSKENALSEESTKKVEASSTSAEKFEKEEKEGGKEGKSSQPGLLVHAKDQRLSVNNGKKKKDSLKAPKKKNSRSTSCDCSKKNCRKDYGVPPIPPSEETVVSSSIQDAIMDLAELGKQMS